MFRSRETKLHELVRRIEKNDTMSTEVILNHENVDDAGAKKIAAALRHNNTLTYLDLESNSIGDEGAKALAEALRQNTTLTKFNLYDNSIGNKGGKAIAEALRHNTTLTLLGLNNNGIRDEGGKALAEALRQNTTLTWLSLGDNDIGDEGGKALAEALRQNTTLTELDLFGNIIGEDTMKKVQRFIKINKESTTVQEAERRKAAEFGPPASEYLRGGGDPRRKLKEEEERADKKAEQERREVEESRLHSAEVKADRELQKGEDNIAEATDNGGSVDPVFEQQQKQSANVQASEKAPHLTNIRPDANPPSLAATESASKDGRTEKVKKVFNTLPYLPTLNSQPSWLEKDPTSIMSPIEAVILIGAVQMLTSAVPWPFEDWKSSLESAIKDRTSRLADQASSERRYEPKRKMSLHTKVCKPKELIETRVRDLEDRPFFPFDPPNPPCSSCHVLGGEAFLNRTNGKCVACNSQRLYFEGLVVDLDDYAHNDILELDESPAARLLLFLNSFTQALEEGCDRDADTIKQVSSLRDMYEVLLHGVAAHYGRDSGSVIGGNVFLTKDINAIFFRECAVKDDSDNSSESSYDDSSDDGVMDTTKVAFELSDLEIGTDIEFLLDTSDIRLKRIGDEVTIMPNGMGKSESKAMVECMVLLGRLARILMKRDNWEATFRFLTCMANESTDAMSSLDPLFDLAVTTSICNVIDPSGILVWSLLSDQQACMICAPPRHVIRVAENARKHHQTCLSPEDTRLYYNAKRVLSEAPCRFILPWQFKGMSSNVMKFKLNGIRVAEGSNDVAMIEFRFDLPFDDLKNVAWELKTAAENEVCDAYFVDKSEEKRRYLSRDLVEVVCFSSGSITLVVVADIVIVAGFLNARSFFNRKTTIIWWREVVAALSVAAVASAAHFLPESIPFIFVALLSAAIVLFFLSMRGGIRREVVVLAQHQHIRNVISPVSRFPHLIEHPQLDPNNEERVLHSDPVQNPQEQGNHAPVSDNPLELLAEEQRREREDFSVNLHNFGVDEEDRELLVAHLTLAHFVNMLNDRFLDVIIDEMHSYCSGIVKGMVFRSRDRRFTYSNKSARYFWGRKKLEQLRINLEEILLFGNRQEHTIYNESYRKLGNAIGRDAMFDCMARASGIARPLRQAAWRARDSLVRLGADERTLFDFVRNRLALYGGLRLGTDAVSNVPTGVLSLIRSVFGVG